METVIANLRAPELRRERPEGAGDAPAVARGRVHARRVEGDEGELGGDEHGGAEGEQGAQAHKDPRGRHGRHLCRSILTPSIGARGAARNTTGPGSPPPTKVRSGLGWTGHRHPRQDARAPGRPVASVRRDSLERVLALRRPRDRLRVRDVAPHGLARRGSRRRMPSRRPRPRARADPPLRLPRRTRSDPRRRAAPSPPETTAHAADRDRPGAHRVVPPGPGRGRARTSRASPRAPSACAARPRASSRTWRRASRSPRRPRCAPCPSSSSWTTAW